MTSISTVRTHHTVSLIVTSALFFALAFLAYEQEEWQNCVSKRHEIRCLVSVNSTLILGHCCQI